MTTVARHGSTFWRCPRCRAEHKVATGKLTSDQLDALTRPLDATAQEQPCTLCPTQQEKARRVEYRTLLQGPGTITHKLPI